MYCTGHHSVKYNTMQNDSKAPHIFGFFTLIVLEAKITFSTFLQICIPRPVGRGGAGGCMCTPLSD